MKHLATLLLVAGLSACASQAPVAPPLAGPPSTGLSVRGAVDVELNVAARTTGTTGTTGSVRVSPSAAVATSAATFTAPGGYQVINDLSTNTVFISGTFSVHANTPFSNLTLYALSTPANLGGTALKDVRAFSNTPLTDPEAARRVKPTHGMAASDPVVVDAARADLQVFTPGEAAAVEGQARGLGVIGPGSTVLEYGYVARNTSGGRTFAAGGNGSVTVSVRVPRVSAAEDAYRFTMSFVLADEAVTRVSQSLEEQGDNEGAAARAASMGAELNVLPGTRLAGRPICRVRTAGPASSLTASLVSSVPALFPAPSSATMFAPRTAPAQAAFCNASLDAASLTGATAVLTGFQTPFARLTPTLDPSDAGLVRLAGPAGGFKAGEEVEVSLTSGITASSGTLPGLPYVYRYRVASSPATAVFETKQDYWTNSYPGSVAMGDLNGDGKLDLVASGTGNVSVLLGNGDGTLQSVVNYLVGAIALSVALGDLNSDGRLDIVTANYDTNSISVLLGNGDGTFQPKVDNSYDVSRHPVSVAVGDLNGDGKLDLAVATNDYGIVSLLFGVGDGTFRGNGSIGSTDLYPHSVALGDLNGDGSLDLATANDGSNNVSVALGNGDGTFKMPSNYGAGTYPTSIAVGDLNGDGKLDLAAANDGSDNASVLLGLGDGTFHKAVAYGTGVSPRSVAVGDLNGDGKLDLITANYNSLNASVLLGNGDGTFQMAVNYGARRGPTSVAVGDLNGDGKLDLAIANQVALNTSVLLNH